MRDVRALSVQQPWASLIAGGQKTLELRTWWTHARGDLLICAGGRPSRRAGARELYDPATMPLGVAVALVDLADVVEVDLADPEVARAACVPPSEGRAWGWALRHPRAVDPLPVKGTLGLFRVTIG
jgi:hypothetical protein